jgi:hypothetical protein
MWGCHGRAIVVLVTSIRWADHAQDAVWVAIVIIIARDITPRRHNFYGGAKI